MTDVLINIIGSANLALMRILISKDDGIYSPGIAVLEKSLKGSGEITVVAPAQERSTAGHSLTLHKPLRIEEVNEGHYAINGTPADCIWLGIRKILNGKKPDVVFSGINQGGNLGYDIHYSGTVAAAREACLLGIPAVAISLAIFGERKGAHYETAARFAAKLLHEMSSYAEKNKIAFGKIFPFGVFLNANIPNLPESEIKGVKVAKMGHRIYSEGIIEKVDPRGQPYYWIGGEYQGFKDIDESDCKIIDEGYISLTPLQVNSTDPNFYETLLKWDLK